MVLHLALTLLAQSETLPKGAISLFDGRDTSAWVHRSSGKPVEWAIVEGALEVKPGTADIVSRREFGDYRLHVEFWLPLEVEKSDQARGNSGLYNHGRYEIQILDMYKNTTYPFGGCGAIYGQKDPDKDSIKPPQNWNTYDVLFRAPRFAADGSLVAKPRVTVFHNGIKIHSDVEIAKPTTAGLDEKFTKTGPILLQCHGSAVRFRNIWIVPIEG